VPTLKKLFPNLPMAQNSNEYSELCNHYLVNHVDRITLISNIHKEILNNHTYHNRLSRLFKELGFINESEEMLR